MLVDADQIRPRDVYRHLISLITPRPIAWVSTRSKEGVSNLAPFSFFSGVGSRPPSLLFCPANRRDGSRKDTLRNVEQTGEFVVNLVSAELAQAMHNTSADYDDQTSEFSACGLTEAPAERVGAPRVAEAKASIECRLMQTMHLGTGPGASNIVVGQILLLHLDDSIVGADGWADPDRLDTIGRMGGRAYTYTRDRFELPPPGMSLPAEDES